FASKVLSLPHLNAVLLSRGQFEIMVRAWSALMIPLTARTIEEAAQRLPQMLSTISDDYCDRQGVDDYQSIGLVECVLAGWSPAKNRMRLWQYSNFENFQTHETPADWSGTVAWPILADRYMPRIVGFPSDAQLVKIIEAVGKYFTDEPSTNCNQQVGGEC